MLPIVQKYYNALQYFNQDNIESQKIYHLLKKVGEPKFIIDAQERSLTCLTIGSIVGQKISFAKARKIRSNIYTQLGTKFTVKHLFKLDQNNWKSFGLENFQINAIRNLLNMHQKREISLERIDKINKLRQVHGIGPWTIDNIKIMYQVHNFKTIPDIILTNDYIINKALDAIYGKNNHSIQKLEQLWTDSETGESYIGLVHWYLWRHAKGIIY